MNDLDHARLLVQMAHRDLRALGGMLSEEVFSEEVFGFHAQQAVEKATKASLSALHVRYPITHDLPRLFETVRSAGESIPAEFIPLEDLTEFAVQYRYEPLQAAEPPTDRRRVLDLVRRFLEHVEKSIG
jgi:HEPN domain-containing protein